MSVYNQRFADYFIMPQGMFSSIGLNIITVFCMLMLLLQGQKAFTQDINCDTNGLVCNNNLQVSINYDCTLDLDIDRFVENPIDGADYSLQLFDKHKRPIPEITEKEIGEQISYNVTCGGNSCWGHVIIESNHLPVFDAPCQVRKGEFVPLHCRTWCGTDIPSVFIDLKEMNKQMEDMCLPTFLGDIKQTVIRDGDICEPSGETVTLIHEVKVLAHGTLKIVEILRQTVIQQKIDLDTSPDNPDNSIVFPENLMLNCDEGYTPEELLLTDKNYHNAYPIYIDKHNMVPDSIYRCDTSRISETIIGYRDTVIATDTIDGVLVWEELTVVDKEFEDSISCGIKPVFNPDSTFILVPQEVPLGKRLCNIAASFSDVDYNACGSGKKVVRNWKIIDWCDASVELSNPQTIEVTDTEKPVILEEISEMDILIEPWACSARGKLPEILAEDNCGKVNIKWHTDEGVINGDIISELWIQNSPIVLNAYVGDDCDNIDTLTIAVNIVDDTPPVAICNTSMQIVLTGNNVYEFDNGTAKLWAEDFDEGSYDAQCGKVEFFVVRAEDWSVPVNNCDGEFVGFSPQSCSAKTEIVDLGELKSKQCEYTGKNRRPFVTKPAEFIKFCCEDANKIIDVIFIAQDKAGNTNECLVTILVENTNGPELVCEDVVITCEDDIHAVQKPELIDGDVCPVSILPIQLSAESVNRSNCDSIVVTKEWYIDADNDGASSAGDPHCAQHISIIGGNNNVEFICEDLVLPCTIDVDSLPLPKIAGNEFCVCDESLIKVGSFSYANNTRCSQDTLIVSWYFDDNNDNLPSNSEASCTQRIVLSSNLNQFDIDCQAVTINCSQSLADAVRPTLLGIGDHCICPDDFLKTEYVGQSANNCQNETIQRSWYIDTNDNDRKEDNEPACIQDISIDYSQVMYDINCTNINLTCEDDPNSFFDEPEIIRVNVCDCPDPLIYLLEEVRINNSCAVDTISRKWFVDINGNETYEIEEPKCEQFLFIDNLPAAVNIMCEDANIDCLDELGSLYIPTVENQNTCGCTSNQLELRNQTPLDDLCYGDVITREWYVDLNLNNNFDNNEPVCVQNLTLSTPEESPVQSDAMSFDCTPISVTCVENLDNIQAPTLFTSGLCLCENVSVNLNSQSSFDNTCIGDTLFREWYADLNNNNVFDSQEPFCNQALIVVGSTVSRIICTDQVITCTDELSTLPVPRIEQDGFCDCNDQQANLLSESSTQGLCVGDSIIRMWYLDINTNANADEDEPFCEQVISIQDVFPGQINNCGEISISCDSDISTLIPSLTVGEGICSCDQNTSLIAEDTGSVEDLCFNDTLQRIWFIDINNNGLREVEEPNCVQSLIVNIADTISLTCEDYTIGCTELNSVLIPPSIAGSSCECDEIEVLLLSEFGADDGCVGDTLFREWYADENGNGSFDQNEIQCIQNIVLTDDDALVSFDCQPISITCTTDPQTLPIPGVSIESACGCMEFTPILFRDGLLDSLCVGDTTSRMYYIDLDGDNFADEDEPYCLQAINVLASEQMDMSILSDTINISCSTNIDSLIPTTQSAEGICLCEESTPLVLINEGNEDYCINDTITREWIIDLNENNTLDANENIFTQIFIVDASVQSIELSCTNQLVDCQFDQVPAQLPTVNTADGCTCSEIPVLIQSQFGAEDRCVGDTLFRVWYADINRDNNFNAETEPTCTQNIILQDSEAMVSFQCENVSISCQTVSDSIPIPTLITESGCGCMDIQPTLLSDGSLAGICFGESFTREWYVDMNNDGIPQDEEASCRQVVTVDGSMSDMTFNCQEQMITCLDTLANIAPPEINTVGICTCNQFDLSIAEVIIDGSICVGDTIIQRWFVDSNPNNQFDSLDISCDQILILEGEAEAEFLCADIPIDCEADINSIPPPAILGQGLCSCTDLPTRLISQSDVGDQKCIGDEIIKEWYLDMNSDSIQDDDDPVCEQRFIIIGQNDLFEFQNCDTLSITCTTDISTIPTPTISTVSECSCDTILVLARDILPIAQLCANDTFNRRFYGDTNMNNTFDDGEPTCEQVVIVDDSSLAFDPFTIKWPNIFTGETIAGKQLTCENDSIIVTDEFIGTGDFFNCMPQDFESRPYWCETDCGLVTYTLVSDTSETFDACILITNTHTIIDWCTLNPEITDITETDDDDFEIVRDLSPGNCLSCPNNSDVEQDSVYFRYVDVELDGVYQFVQEISVQDDEPPIVTFMQDTVFVNVAAVDTSMNCMASVDINAEAMDMCGGQPTSDDMIQWSVRIVDEDRMMIPNPDGPDIINARGGAITVNSRNGMPGDTFSIVWTVRDGCNSASIRETQVVFFDTTGMCDTMTTSSGIIAGEIHTEFGAMIENAMVSLDKGRQEETDFLSTSIDGTFAFYNNPMHSNYKINVSKEDSFNNGVSTADLILIYNHITGDALLNSPYKIIAADANNDQSLTVQDLAEIKKLILQTSDSYTNNESWRFLKESYQFFDESIPWPFLEASNITDLQHDMMDENFIGIKIGDVNGDAFTNNQSNIEIRNQNDFVIFTDDIYLNPNELFTIYFQAHNQNQIKGLQGTIELLDLDLIDVESGALIITKEDFYYRNNMLSISAHNLSQYDTEDLFSIRVQARKQLKLSEALYLNSTKTNAEIYLHHNLDLFTPILSFNDQVGPIFEVGQNKPNPFSYETTIDITIPESGQTQLSIYNVTGQIIFKSSKIMKKGKNTVFINAELLPNEGLYTYIVEFKGQRIINQMLLID